MKIKKLPRILPSMVVKINKFKLKDKLYGRDIIWRFNKSKRSEKGDLGTGATRRLELNKNQLVGSITIHQVF